MEESDIKYVSSLIDDNKKTIKISVKKNGKKYLTTIIGHESNNLKSDLRFWKIKYSCNRFIKNGNIYLQGDQTDNIYNFLLKAGYHHDQLIITGK